jgi:hypothetical protein
MRAWVACLPEGFYANTRSGGLTGIRAAGGHPSYHYTDRNVCHEDFNTSACENVN